MVAYSIPFKIQELSENVNVTVGYNFIHIGLE